MLMCIADSMVFPLMRKAALAVGAMTMTDGLSSSCPDFAFNCLIAYIKSLATYDFPVPASPAM